MKSFNLDIVQTNGILADCTVNITCKDIVSIEEKYFVKKCCGDPYTLADSKTIGAEPFTMVTTQFDGYYLSTNTKEEIELVCDGCEC